MKNMYLEDICIQIIINKYYSSVIAQYSSEDKSLIKVHKGLAQREKCKWQISTEKIFNIISYQEN